MEGKKQNIFPNKKLPHLRCLWFSALQSTFLWSLERNEKRWRPFQIRMYWRLRFWQVSECGESERAAAYAIAFSGGGEGTRENGGGVLFCGFAMAAAALFLPSMLGCWSLGARFFNRPVMHGLSFLQKIANYRCVCLPGKLLFKFFCIYLLLKNLINEKYFRVKEKFSLIFRKVFSFYFEQKTLSRSCEKFRNIILFADYIKFGSQNFDWYRFCLNPFFFQFHLLKFDLIWFLY